ncbi:IclR family transcriptional regulator [Streptomyces boninensis]|uniref:IclR family transcriptional regulator n=1 Tax=Streptomyces boninensis TaxID=2039455 RepID=UPI003B21665A
MDQGSSKPPSPAADRTLTILETLVRAEEPLILTALAKKADIPLATCAAIVQTLEQRGYAARKVIGRSHYWRPTLALYGLSAQLIRRLDLPTVSQSSLRTLAEETGLPAHVGVLDGPKVVYVAKAAPPGRFIHFNTHPGKVASFNLTALGKAIAAYLPPDELAPLLDHLAAGAGPKAHGLDTRPLLDELAETRVRGYAIEDEEEEADIACVAAPLFDSEEKVVGSVGVTGFARELKDDRLEAAIEALKREGQSISERLGYARTR